MALLVIDLNVRGLYTAPEQQAWSATSLDDRFISARLLRIQAMPLVSTGSSGAEGIIGHRQTPAGTGWLIALGERGAAHGMVIFATWILSLMAL